MVSCANSSRAICASAGWRHAMCAYRRDIPALHRFVMAGEGPQWDAAKDLSAEMMKRFARVLVDTPTQRAREMELADAA